jgi:hypothetical protein
MPESKALGRLLGLVRGQPGGPGDPGGPGQRAAGAGPCERAAGTGEAALELAAAAREQGLGAWLLGEIEAGRLAWAGPVRERLVGERRTLLVRTLGQIALASRCARLLAARGMRTLALKGVAIAETVCDLEAERPMSDVDLLALDDWRGAIAVLAEAGFLELARADHAWAFRDPVSGGVLELHRSVTSAPGLFPCDGEGAWRRRRAGRTPPLELPGPEDLLLWLALHASFQHGFVLSLSQWLDFRRVIERERVDGALLRDLAEQARALPALGAALLVAEAVVGLKLPSALAPLTHELPRGLRRWLSPRLARASLFLSPSQPQLARARFELLARRRAELLWRTLVLPETTRGDRRPLPRLAQGLGRVLQVLRRHGLRRETRPAPTATRIAGAREPGRKT